MSMVNLTETFMLMAELTQWVSWSPELAPQKWHQPIFTRLWHEAVCLWMHVHVAKKYAAAELVDYPAPYFVNVKDMETVITLIHVRYIHTHQMMRMMTIYEKVMIRYALCFFKYLYVPVGRGFKMSIQCRHCSFIIIEDKLTKYWLSISREEQSTGGILYVVILIYVLLTWEGSIVL